MRLGVVARHTRHLRPESFEERFDLEFLPVRPFPQAKIVRRAVLDFFLLLGGETRNSARVTSALAHARRNRRRRRSNGRLMTSDRAAIASNSLRARKHDVLQRPCWQKDTNRIEAGRLQMLVNQNHPSKALE